MTTVPLADDERRMVEDNMGLVYFVVGHLAALRPDLADDRVQDGMLGLIAAVRRFDPDRGVAFSTYAVAMIRGRITRGAINERGGNYRFHHRNGTLDVYEPPVRLDDDPYENDGAWVGSGDVPDTGGARLADVDPTVEEVAIAAEMQQALYAEAVAVCRDDLDRDIVSSWFDDFGLHRQPSTELAERHGVTGTTVRNRRKRLEKKLYARHHGLTP